MRDGILRLYLDWASTRIWLIPTVCCALAIGAALILLQIDRTCAICSTLAPSIAVDVDTTRSLMGVLATGILSVGGVSFSVQMVALTLTSGQYGPKIMRHFLADTRSKVSIGLFFATAVFALVVFIGLSENDIPRWTTLAAMLLTLASLIEFIRFIHRTASDLQADQIIHRLGASLQHDLREMLANPNQANSADDTLPWRRLARSGRPTAIGASATGYVQTIDYDQVLQALHDARSVALLRVQPGDFVVQGGEWLRYWPAAGGEEATGPDPQETAESRKLQRSISASITVGDIRTPAQDPKFPISQIQQIAARALSTGINDPGTAVTCIDWLTVALAEIIDKPMPGSVRLDQEDVPRLLIPRFDFYTLVESVYTPLRRFVVNDLQAGARLLDSLSRLADCTTQARHVDALREQGYQLMREMESRELAEYDQRPMLRRFRRLQSRRAVATT